MPLEEDAANEELRRYLVKKDYYSVSILKDYLREVILLQASDSHLLSVLFRQTMEIIGRSIPFEEEPMINLLGWCDNCQWTVCLFPRRTRRPRQFYAEGTEKILFSPGCVDMAGLIISPREEDFRKYSAGLLTDMFSQATAGPDSWEAIQKELIRLKVNLAYAEIFTPPTTGSRYPVFTGNLFPAERNFHLPDYRKKIYRSI